MKIYDERYERTTKLARVCKCGHSITIWGKDGYITCKWCGRLVFSSKRIEMKYRQKEIISKLKKDLEDK